MLSENLKLSFKKKNYVVIAIIGYFVLNFKTKYVKYQKGHYLSLFILWGKCPILPPQFMPIAINKNWSTNYNPELGAQ
jgi:hypothetical protein